jgi:pimeloyl-ACP methyl ester carboxylesterase
VDTGSDEDSPAAEDTSDTASDEDTSDPDPGAYSGDLEIILYTQFGEDNCNGSADLDVDDVMGLTGSGRCSFTILGSQVPLFAGELSESGAVNGTVDLEAFGTEFTLDWTGSWSESEVLCDYSSSASLDSIGDIDYEIRLNLTAEIEDESTVPSGTDYVDFRLRGTQTTSMDIGTFTSSDGCEMDYEMVEPTGASADTLVVIQHGFARSADQFSDWSGHLASWGLPSLTMSLCHSSALDVNLDQNGADVVELVAHLHDGPVIYMGHSNGAVSSLVSASLDDDAVAVLGLDAVERLGGDHTDDAASLGIPVYGIFGESGYCNSWNSGLSAYQSTSEQETIRVTEADHCDFEAPTNATCTLACGGSNSLFDDDSIQSTIVGLATAFLSWQALDDADGQAWWDASGSARTALEDSGAISGL